MTVAYRPIVVVTGRRRPHEQLFLAFGALSGAVYLIGAPPPASVAALMSPLLVKAWAGGLVLSGVVGLLGCWMHPSGRSLRLEQGGMLIGAAALLVYTTAAFSLAGWRALFGGGIAAAWTVANLTRAWQADRDIRQLHKARGF